MFNMMAAPLDPETMLFALIAIVTIVIGIKSIVIVRPFERGIVEQFGKYSRTLGSGLSTIIPFVENVYRVDMREALLDVPAQEVITKDNVHLTVDAIIYFKVIDPFRVMYNVAMFEEAISKLAQTNLRNIIGDMMLDNILASRDKINMELRKALDEITDRWGVRVTRVEIQDIQPPKDIVDAMSRQMKAERTKRAAVLEAEAVKLSEILKAEGKKASDILTAEGQAQAIKNVAEADKQKLVLLGEGEARAIEKVYGAIHEGRPTKDLLMIKYLEALGKMADGKATKIFMPVETSGMLSTAGVIGEMLRGEKGEPLLPDADKSQMRLGDGGKKQEVFPKEGGDPNLQKSVYEDLTGLSKPKKKTDNKDMEK
jgi:regulator of protease activity HflC (stomatin/prohibitin superfamily)